MPEYDYHCNECGKKYSVFMWVSDRAAYLPACPACGSASCEQEIGLSGVVTDKHPHIQLP